MFFSTWDYVSAGVLVPLGLVTLLLLLAIIIGLKLAQQNTAIWLRMLPVWTWLIVTLGGISLCARGMEYPLTAWIQANQPIYVTTGQITNIVDAPSPPVYGASLQPAKLVTINDETFYAITVNVEEGAYVKIRWSTDARIVYALERIDSEDLIHGEHIIEQADVESSKESSVGKWVLHISIALFLIAFILQYPLGKRIAPVLMKKDRLVTTGVFPNRYGIFHYCVVFCLLCCVLLGFRLTGFYGVGIIFAIALSMMVAMLICKQSVKVTLQQDVLVYKELCREQRIPLEYISSVEWGRSGIPYNRQLIIRLQTGRAIFLQQEHFWGLENLFKQLEQRSGQGDGLREPF